MKTIGSCLLPTHTPSDYIPSMIMDSWTRENDFNLIEKLASEESQKRKAQADEYGVSEESYSARFI